MKKQYMFGMFMLCFFVWIMVVDNVLLPSSEQCRQDVGVYTRYRVKSWAEADKLELLTDELLIYAIVKNREQLYYMDYKPQFETALKNMPEGTPLQLRYVRRFPKFWKRSLYDVRINGVSHLMYSAYALKEKQQAIWNFTGIMAGIYAFLILLGLINKPRPK
jgi:hypothetical protein